MPAFQQIVLDRTHHKCVFCCRCGCKLKPGEQAWRHTGKNRSRYYCKSCFKALWH